MAGRADVQTPAGVTPQVMSRQPILKGASVVCPEKARQELKRESERDLQNVLRSLRGSRPRRILPLQSELDDLAEGAITRCKSKLEGVALYYINKGYSDKQVAGELREFIEAALGLHPPGVSLCHEGQGGGCRLRAKASAYFNSKKSSLLAMVDGVVVEASHKAPTRLQRWRRTLENNRVYAALALLLFSWIWILLRFLPFSPQTPSPDPETPSSDGSE